MPPGINTGLAPPQPPPSKRSRTPTDSNNTKSNSNSKNNTTELEEGERLTYPVKKYRSNSYYRSIEAFSRYTKSHRMLDAAYVRYTSGGGSTPEKPIVFGIKIAGSFLSWGRGKTRDAAIDASIRAAFALVAAHGYDDFALTEDCFTEEPSLFDASANNMAPLPPPPPPPPMFGMPGMPPGMAGMAGMAGMGIGIGIAGIGGAPPLPPGLPPPPLPPGMPPPNFGAPPPNFAVPPPTTQRELIPQPLAPKADLAVASTVVTSEGTTAIPAVTVLLANNTTTTTNGTEVKKNGGGNEVVFAGGELDEEQEELSMEEKRMQVGRYWTLVVKALAKR